MLAKSFGFDEWASIIEVWETTTIPLPTLSLIHSPALCPPILDDSLPGQPPAKKVKLEQELQDDDEHSVEEYFEEEGEEEEPVEEAQLSLPQEDAESPFSPGKFWRDLFKSLGKDLLATYASNGFEEFGMTMRSSVSSVAPGLTHAPRQHLL